MDTDDFEIKESARSKHLRITVHPDGRVVVTKPPRVSSSQIKAFITERADWIEAARAHMQKANARDQKKYGSSLQLPRLRRGTAAYKDAIKQARSMAKERIEHFAELGGFSYGAISIRNQKTRWGSCSHPKRGLSNLSFNYRIVHLPPALVDYLMVHELAHTKQHNHSAAFWAEVGKLIPNYVQQRKELHRYRW